MRSEYTRLDNMIDILLATYNGEKYLKQQLESIFAQTNQDWRILVRDDGSNDNTAGIVKDCMAQHPGRISMISDDKGRHGACLNFGKLLEQSTAEYIMFSDQDDVWLPNKIELTLCLMKSAELVYPNMPLLVHGDMRVVDSNLNIMADSHWSLTKISPFIGDDVNKVMVEGLVSGNTMMINKMAKEVSVPIPEEALGHDRWISIKVAKNGRIVYSSIPCTLYRQHFSNYIGSREKNVGLFVRNMYHIKRQYLVYQRIYSMAKKCDHDFTWWKFIKTKIILLFIKFFRSF